MRRQASLTGVAFCLALVTVSGGTVPPAHAQAPVKVYRIGWLTTGPHPFIEAFRQALRELGYVEDRNLVIEERYAGDKPERLPELAEELLRLKVDLVITSGRAATAAAQKVSATVPVVFVTGNPVGEGFARSLAAPGGNLTGLALLNPELAAKWIELAKDTLPAISRVAILWDPNGDREQRKTAKATTRFMGLAWSVLEARSAGDIERAFAMASRQRVGALIILSSAFFASERQRIVSLAARYRLPVVYEHRDFVEAGGLMSYGPDLRDVFRRAATYVDKVLKGARPAELPIEQPAKLEMVINLKTARDLGLAIPQSLLVRADAVIQ
ncbi:MAG TPA: ABC transporter substrate-binding protein [Methylomirabilota bacterium]|nr:ABC transporter substrate-binding protein [Methylomirabilota bacterium]